MARKASITHAAKSRGTKAAPRARRVPGVDVTDLPPAHEPPTPLADIVGHDRPIRRLHEAMSSGRLSHCWLFSGPPGVGKFTTALAFAAVLLDPAAGPGLDGLYAADPQGHAASLLRAATHPGLHVIRKELAAFSSDAQVRDSRQTNIPVEVVREFLVAPAKLAPGLPGGLASKVFVVDEAELLDDNTGAAQNTLLKTLEEPTPGTIIILVSASERRLLPTIRSRAQRLAFTPLEPEDLRRCVARLAADAPPQDVAAAVELAGGCPGVALEFVREGAIDLFRAVEPMLAMAAGGQFPSTLAETLTKHCNDWADTWARKDARRSKEIGNRAAMRRVLRLVGAYAERTMQSGAHDVGAGFADAIASAEQRNRANTSMALVFEGLSADLTEAGRRALPEARRSPTRVRRGG